MKKYIFIAFTILFSLKGHCQFEDIKFETDSSNIELIRNSVYRIWEESYKNKDSVLYSVRYIKDTTQLHIEGWHKKNGQYIGEWSEYKIDGTWLYTIDYTNHTWKYNNEEFKYQKLKDSIKTKADLILSNKFGKAFFEQNVVFNFYGHTYIGKWETYETGTFWRQDKNLGSWKEPINQEPNSYHIDYTIKLSDNEFYDGMLSIELDSTGNLISNKSRFEIEFEEIQNYKGSTFKITREKAIELCEKNKIEDVEVKNYESNLRFGWRKLAEYPGTYYYEVVSFINEEIEGDCKEKCLIKRYYYVWRFNPWTLEIIEKNKMIEISRLNRGCMVSGGFEKIKE